MKNFATKSGVDVFETGGPNGLIRIEAGKPLSTDDPAVISILENSGAHALTISDGKTAVVVDEKHQKDGER